MKRRKETSATLALPYRTMSLESIKALPIKPLASAEGCLLWLWTTNQFLGHGFEVLSAWGFKYLAPVHWEKPSGTGNWFVHRTQTALVGYTPPLRMAHRYRPNTVKANPPRHSEKPPEMRCLIEAVGFGARLDVFARRPAPGWVCVGDEIDGRDVRDALLRLQLIEQTEMEL